MGGQFLQEPPPPEARLTQPSNPKFFKSVSKTIEEHAEHLKGSPIEIIQISRGEFNGRSTVLDLGGITLANRHANAQYIGQGHSRTWLRYCSRYRINPITQTGCPVQRTTFR